jgi:hypothetical protein
VLRVAAAGSGYADTSSAEVTGGNGTGMTLNITTENGAITAVAVSNPGTGYQPGDVLAVKRGGDTGDAQVVLLGTFDQDAGTFAAIHTYEDDSPFLTNPLEIEVTVADDDGGQGTDTVEVAIEGVPMITSDAVVDAPENQTSVVDVESTDPAGATEGAGLTYRLTGGFDSDLFTIVPATGVLTFKEAPDFEMSLAAGGKNAYDVQVGVSTASGLTIVQNIEVNVTNVNEVPSIISEATADANERQTFALDVQSTDLDGEVEGAGLTYSLTGGADVDKFSIGTNTGLVTFNVAPNFRSPGDADANNVYEFQVTVTDGGGLTDMQDIAVTVTEVVTTEPAEITLDSSILLENLDGLVVGILAVDNGDPIGSYQLSVDDSRFEFVSAALKLKDDVFLALDSGATVTITVTATIPGSPESALTKTIALSVLANPLPWQNSANVLDSSRDGSVSAIDALVTINLLNAPNNALVSVTGKLPQSRPHVPSDPIFDPLYDTNGDGFASPLDVLIIINFLNDPTSFPGEGEALASGATPVVWPDLKASGRPEAAEIALVTQPAAGDDDDAFRIVGEGSPSLISRVSLRTAEKDDDMSDLLDTLAADIDPLWRAGKWGLP